MKWLTRKSRIWQIQRLALALWIFFKYFFHLIDNIHTLHDKIIVSERKWNNAFFLTRKKLYLEYDWQ